MASCEKLKMQVLNIIFNLIIKYHLHLSRKDRYQELDTVASQGEKKSTLFFFNIDRNLRMK